MKKDRILPIFFFSLTLFLISFIFGYQLMGKKLNQNNLSKRNDNEIDMSENSGLEILSEETRISPNSFIEERIHYTACDHVVTKVEVVENQLINMTKNELSEYLSANYPNKRLISYSTNKITLGSTKDFLCENHFIIGEENGLIAIFRIGENGDRILDNVFTEYPISLLMEVDQKKIIEGIVVDSEEELSEILENFIS